MQARITVAATVAALVLLTVAAVGMGKLFESHLVDQVDDELVADARVVQRALDRGSTNALRRSGALADVLVQVLNRNGDVIGGSAAAAEIPPLVEPEVLSATERRITTVEVDDVGAVRVLVVRSDGRAAMLVVGRPIRQAQDASGSFEQVAVLAVPLISALLAALVWFVVGRALRPVEQATRTVDAISESDLSARVPVPNSGDEIERLVTTMNDMLDRVEGAVVRERRLVADASHELRSPLAGARVLLETELDDPGAVASSRAEALATLARLEGVVDQMLHLARSDGVVDDRSNDTLVDLDELVLAQAARLRRTTKLNIDTSSVSGGQVRGRANDLGRLIENLTANAVRHATSTIRLAIYESGDVVRFVVDDDGPGVPEAEREHIFGRFARLDDARTRDAGGAGLGLSIVASIVTAHDGTVKVVESALGGARFVVELPRV